MLRKVSHKNVIKLITTEIITETCGIALIMEYANSNLKKIINSERNGVSSEQFSHICQDLLSAVKYLRQVNIVHRDIKPNNILSFDSNGKIIYKLCDFGEARILNPNEEYGSIHGTPEYMHPDIYGKYYSQLLNIKSSTHTFTDICELWSIGVTLYEVASGDLPFKPKFGRLDIRTMYKMTKTKPCDSISAKETEDGKIEWSSQLPDCALDDFIKQAVTSFLAVLLRVSLKLSDLMSRRDVILIIKKIEDCNSISVIFHTAFSWNFIPIREYSSFHFHF